MTQFIGLVHFHILHRDIPFILNIILSITILFNSKQPVSQLTVNLQGAEDEATGTYLCRVLVSQYPLPSAPAA